MRKFNYKCVVTKNGTKMYYKKTKGKWKRISNAVGMKAEKGRRKYRTICDEKNECRKSHPCFDYIQGMCCKKVGHDNNAHINTSECILPRQCPVCGPTYVVNNTNDYKDHWKRGEHNIKMINSSDQDDTEEDDTEELASVSSDGSDQDDLIVELVSVSSDGSDGGGGGGSSGSGNDMPLSEADPDIPDINIEDLMEIVQIEENVNVNNPKQDNLIGLIEIHRNSLPSLSSLNLPKQTEGTCWIFCFTVLVLVSSKCRNFIFNKIIDGIPLLYNNSNNLTTRQKFRKNGLTYLIGWIFYIYRSDNQNYKDILEYVLKLQPQFCDIFNSIHNVFIELLDNTNNTQNLDLSDNSVNREILNWLNRVSSPNPIREYYNWLISNNNNNNINNQTILNQLRRLLWTSGNIYTISSIISKILDFNLKIYDYNNINSFNSPNNTDMIITIKTINIFSFSNFNIGSPTHLNDLNKENLRNPLPSIRINNITYNLVGAQFEVYGHAISGFYYDYNNTQRQFIYNSEYIFQGEGRRIPLSTYQRINWATDLEGNFIHIMNNCRGGTSPITLNQDGHSLTQQNGMFSFIYLRDGLNN